MDIFARAETEKACARAAALAYLDGRNLAYFNGVAKAIHLIKEDWQAVCDSAVDAPPVLLADEAWETAPAAEFAKLRDYAESASGSYFTDDPSDTRGLAFLKLADALNDAALAWDKAHGSN